MTKKIVITGIGIISPIGLEPEVFFNNLIIQNSAFSARTFVENNLPNIPDFYGSFLKEFSSSNYLEGKGLRTLNYESQLFMSAAVNAFRQANLNRNLLKERMGVCCASIFAGYNDYAKLFVDGMSEGLNRINPAQGPQTGFNAPASQLAIYLDAQGPNMTITSGLASGLDAVAVAADFIVENRADVILVGGVDCLSYFSAHALLSRYKMECTAQPPKPFDSARQHTVFGEAACTFVIENYNYAVARKAPILAEVCSYGRAYQYPLSSSDLKSVAERAIQQALTESRVSPVEIDAVFASANGNYHLDAAEANALYSVFGNQTPVYSLKGVTGECLGASGAIQAAAAILSMNKRIIPKTFGYDNPDTSLPLISISTETATASLRQVLVNCLDETGYATALILRIPD